MPVLDADQRAGPWQAELMAEDFDALRERYRTFIAERDWGQFHDPKSLLLALVGEVGELAELFQWTPADEAKATCSHGERQQRAGEQMSDVLIYLLALADSLGIDLMEAAHHKLTAAEDRFPVEQVKGRALLKP
ncbi:MULTISPECIES: nucleotide pyrophosphohydrolase [unclassified Luteococcus]|uniref:nucleotide pyrophosphohydrolase n=1 Tax=unclassified Luteococcus TaxID=2639923 RepID=UPI00313B6E9F